jgi:hypothetical protein
VSGELLNFAGLSLSMSVNSAIMALPPAMEVAWNYGGGFHAVKPQIYEFKPFLCRL